MFGSHLENDTEEHHETGDDGRSKSRLTIFGVVLALLVVILGWAGVQALGDDNDSAGVACETTTVRVAAAPAMVDLVEDAVDSLNSDIRCIDIDVYTATVADVVADQDAAVGDADELPNLWVPDSPAWQTALAASDRVGGVLVPSLASSPVALAGGIKQPAGATWSEVLSSPNLEISDPSSDGASALALVTPFGEGDPSAAQNMMVPVAQQYGDDLASGTTGTVTVDNLEAGSPKMVPVTERDFLIAKRGNDSLEWRAPADGVAMLTYPLVQVAEAGANGLFSEGGGLDVAARTGERIAQWFTTTEGKQAIADDQLRGPEGEPLPSGNGVDARKQLPPVPQAQVDAVIKSFNSLKVPSSILALVETSDSMATQFGAMTRIELAADAAKTAVAVFPDAVRLGFRSFSTNQRPDGQDWREVVPLRRLDTPLGQGRTHADFLNEQIDTLASQTSGGAGLYDSILDAYQEASRQYNPYYQNSLVVFADGPNEDPGSISLAQLKRELKRTFDPERPVRIIAIGLTDSADIASLEEIAASADIAASGAHQVLQPDDILTVLASTLLSR